jgi:hypothetical protein
VRMRHDIYVRYERASATTVLNWAFGLERAKGIEPS